MWWIEKEEWDETLHEAVEETVQPEAEEPELEGTDEKKPERESSGWWTRTVYKPCLCKSCSESFSPVMRTSRKSEAVSLSVAFNTQ